MAFTQWVAQRAPHITPVAICVNPAYIEKTYGLSAFPAAARYSAAARGTAAASAASVRAGSEPQRTASLGPGRRLIGRLRHEVARRVRLLALPLRPARHFVQSARMIAGFLPRQLRMVRSLDGVIVLGGGQVHDFWDGPLGHPITLFSWALACRMSGRPFAILSVGAVDLLHDMSRRFVRTAFRWSVHATVRDRESAAVIASMGGPRACPICPDLAWSLDPDRFVAGRPAPPRGASPRMIGVCPMAYRHPKLWASGDAEWYARYIGALTTFCNTLLGQGYEVVLFPTQIRMDPAAVRDVLDGISPDFASRVRLWPVDGVPELIKCLASVDAVVASRFHGVLLSLRTGRPVISLAYQQKCNALLEELGEGGFGLDVHDFSAEELWQRFERLRDRFPAYVGRLQAHIGENREKLDAQYQSFLARLR